VSAGQDRTGILNGEFGERVKRSAVWSADVAPRLGLCRPRPAPPTPKSSTRRHRPRPPNGASSLLPSGPSYPCLSDTIDRFACQSSPSVPEAPPAWLQATVCVSNRHRPPTYRLLGSACGGPWTQMTNTPIHLPLGRLIPNRAFISCLVFQSTFHLCHISSSCTRNSPSLRVAANRVCSET
jgi:hypothetical protein